MDSGEQETNNQQQDGVAAAQEQNQEKKPSLGSRILAANDKRKEIKQNGGLANTLKNAASDKIHDKTNQLKNKAKDKINNAMPDSVKQKKQALQQKKADLQNKMNAPKNKINEQKSKQNEDVLRKSVETAVNAAAPGAGVAAKNLLDTPVGQPALEAARNASNPITALRDGTKKLIEIVVSKQVKKKILMTLLPVLVVVLLFVVLIISVVAKFQDSQTYAKGDPYGGDKVELSEYEEKYQVFYENVEKYASGTDKWMVISVLTAGTDNDDYTDMDAVSEDIDEETGSSEIAEEINGITTYSKSKMKKYIKKVSKKIKESGSVERGSFDDANSGSDFFWWLYDDFIEDYYSEFLSTDNEDKKRELVDFIYLYYEDIKQHQNQQCYETSSLCSGVTIEGSGTYSLEEYVAGVVKAEMGTYHDYPEVMKAFAVAARSFFIASGRCGSVISNSENFQTFREVDPNNALDAKYIAAANDTAGVVVLKNNTTVLSTQYVTIPVSKYRSFNAQTQTWTYTMLHDSSDATSEYTYSMPDADVQRIAQPAGGVYPPSESSGHHWGMLSYGAVYEAEKGKSYEEILKTFYGDNIVLSASTSNCNGISGDLIPLGNEGLYAESVFPVEGALTNFKIWGGYNYYTREDGTSHGAADITCVSGDCTRHRIIASHSGIVTFISRDLCNSYGQSSAQNAGVRFDESCQNGTSLIIKVETGPYKGYEFLYWHLSSIDDSIQYNSQISAGQYLGQMGSTGNSSGTHLHFSIRYQGQRQNFDLNLVELLKQGLTWKDNPYSNEKDT